MTIMTERNFYEAVAHRRTNYALGRNIPVTEETIIDTVEKVTREVPSAFNMQSGRVIVALGQYHDKVWEIVMDPLRKIVPADKFAPTEAKVKGFAAAYGTLLYFEETDTVKSSRNSSRAMRPTSRYGPARATACSSSPFGRLSRTWGWG